MSDLNKQQLQYLKKLTHALKPVVRIGQHGVSDSVLAELDTALVHHELVKLKIAAADRDERQTLLNKLTTGSGSTLIQQIGSVAVLFRRNDKKPVIELPK